MYSVALYNLAFFAKFTVGCTMGFLVYSGFTMGHCKFTVTHCKFTVVLLKKFMKIISGLHSF